MAETHTHHRLSAVSRLLRQSSVRAKLLILPVVVFELAFFVVPFLILVRMSLYGTGGTGNYAAGTWTVDNYVTVFTSDFIREIAIFNVKFAVITTAVTVGIGLFYAYAIWRASRLVQTLLLAAIVLPLLTTLVVKTFSILLLLAPGGTLMDVLIDAGALQDPVLLVHNELGAVLGQIYVLLPYAVLPIYSVLSKLDWQKVEAARDLGASRPRSFVEVILPHAIPGIVVATVITMAWNIGAFAAPLLLGSGSERTFAIEIQSLMFQQFNWPLASALAICVLGLIVASLVAMFKLLDYLDMEAEVW